MCAAALLALAAPARAALQIPALDKRVTDLAGVLPAPQAQALETELSSYEAATGHQLAALLIPSLQGEILEDYSVKVAERWRLGDKKRDDGLLVLVAVRDRKVRVEVGYGLEGVVTDALSQQVIREQMAPRFREGDYAGGLRAAFAVFMAAARGEAVGPATPRDTGSPARGLGVWAFFLVVWIVIALASRRRGRRGGGLVFLPPFGGGWSGGSRSRDDWWSGGSSGGGFSGGGGRFGGGGASGGW